MTGIRSKLNENQLSAIKNCAGLAPQMYRHLKNVRVVTSST